MPLPIPELDDRTYADLVAEALDLIPRVTPEWTDRNPGDPGIALVELLAWLTEMMIFRLDQRTEAHTRAFLALLDGGHPAPDPGTGGDATPTSTPAPAPTQASAPDVRGTLRRLREPGRAVTAEDWELLARRTAGDRAHRVHCLPGWDLSGDPRTRSGHVGVVVVTGLPSQATDPDVLAAVSARLREARLLGTRHHVTGPGWIDVGIRATLTLGEDADPQRTLEDAAARVFAHLHPLPGPGRPGWPLGHPVHVTEIEGVLTDADGVDSVDEVGLDDPAAPTPEPYQLIGTVTLALEGYDAAGARHRLTRSGPS